MSVTSAQAVRGGVGPSRAWYSGTVSEFLSSTPAEIVGRLTSACDYTLMQSQVEAWKAEIGVLRAEMAGVSGYLLLEFGIPRMGRRVDAVLLEGPTVFVIEFKVGEQAFYRSAIEQVWDYALDLKNFHEGSHDPAIIPVLVATEAPGFPRITLQADPDLVYRPIPVSPKGLRPALEEARRVVAGPALNPMAWLDSAYHPTPTIIEAARALYLQHSVEAIARFDAGARNLGVTSGRLEGLIEQARKAKGKYLCLVTGVPGAGKTLVGLNVATRRSGGDRSTNAVFLSGNDPLVAVLREALTRDRYAALKESGTKVRKGEVGESVKAFIQNVHHFRDEALLSARPPFEHVAIFDEAQRAWNLRKTATFMKTKKKKPGFSQSEPEFLLSYMDRHTDWAVVVCLVGGGQEINDGEAGIDAWLDAANRAFPDWQLYISPRLSDSEYASGMALQRVAKRSGVHFDDSLHLAVSMRSFRAEHVSSFVKALLDLDKSSAGRALAEVIDKYPIALTRDLDAAKQWVRAHVRGSERAGLVASSRAERLKPHAIDVRVNTSPVHWFLSPSDDTRSSCYLEDAATEFQVQGLEVDWACVTWDGDFRYSDNGWTYHEFRGSKWNNVKNVDNRNYLRNAYRVLLTRARQGMVVFVPKGDASDPTRPPRFYDSTFSYLKDIGVPVLS